MLAISAIVCGCVQAEKAITVMSFNVRYAKALDGDNSWEHRKEIFADAIRHCNPDILGVQECLDVQAQFITREFPEYRWVGMEREANGTGEMAAIFYRKDLLSPIETGNFWLSDTPDMPGSKSWGSQCTRMATWVRFHHVPSGRFFHVFNTHFDHASEEARQQAAKLLLERLPKADAPVIITGDFNAIAEESPAWKTLADAGLTDAWVSAAEKVGPEATFGNFLPPVEGKKGRIDWIFFRGGFKATRCETVTFNKDGRYPSDHYPVLAKLLLPEGVR